MGQVLCHTASFGSLISWFQRTRKLPGSKLIPAQQRIKLGAQAVREPHRMAHNCFGSPSGASPDSHARSAPGLGSAIGLDGFRTQRSEGTKWLGRRGRPHHRLRLVRPPGLKRTPGPGPVGIFPLLSLIDRILDEVLPGRQPAGVSLFGRALIATRAEAG